IAYGSPSVASASPARRSVIRSTSSTARPSSSFVAVEPLVSTSSMIAIVWRDAEAAVRERRDARFEIELVADALPTQPESTGAQGCEAVAHLAYERHML